MQHFSVNMGCFLCVHICSLNEEESSLFTNERKLCLSPRNEYVSICMKFRVAIFSGRFLIKLRRFADFKTFYPVKGGAKQEMRQYELVKMTRVIIYIFMVKAAKMLTKLCPYIRGETVR